MQAVHQFISTNLTEKYGISQKSNRIFETEYFEETHSFCCPEPAISESEGYMVCTNCGMIFDRVIENNHRRMFTFEEIQQRRINEPVYSPIGPRTVIRGNTDATGALLPAKDQSKFNRLSKIQRSLTTSYERNLWIALPQFQRIQERLGLTGAVADDAMKIYTQAVKARLTMGRSIDILLAGAIYLSVKVHSIPMTVDEITNVVDVSKKVLLKCYRILFEKILPGLNIKVARMTPIKYVEKFSEELKIPMTLRKFAKDILEKAKKQGCFMEGKDPKGYAAASIYIATQENRLRLTQLEIAKASRVTDVTLRLRARELYRYC